MLRQLRFLQPTFDALGDDNRFETHVDDVFALKSNTYFFLFPVRVCVSVCMCARRRRVRFSPGVC